ncbi:MAG: DUF2062 domain-containing protein [Pseudomonadota bacterium]
MPRSVFKKFAVKRHEFGDSWALKPFRKLMQEPRYWGIRRRTVVPAFSLGLFLCFQPIPAQPILATLIALATRINIPIAAATPFISNPLTMPPMYYACYRVGTWLLGQEPQPFDFEMSFEWLTTTFLNYWQPVTLGCVVLGTTAAAVGYIVVDVAWRFTLHDYKIQKRRRRRDRHPGPRKSG